MLKLGQITTRAGGLMWAQSSTSLHDHLTTAARDITAFR